MQSLREQMKMDMELKGLSPNTIKNYLTHMRCYTRYFKKSPLLLEEKEIREYLHHLLTDKELSHSYVNGAYSSLKFFYETTLGQSWDIKRIPRPKKQKKLPVVLSNIEIQQIFSAVGNIKHKAILMTIYGAGLRISEAANLKLTDIDSKRMQIRVRQGKGKKDRYTLLSEANLNVLRLYWKRDKPNLWLFPGKPSDHPISNRTIQRVFLNAKEKAGIIKPATVHSLRHSFATHLLESGASIYHIQNLLGHTNPTTTSIYIHLQQPDILKLVSPLDTLVGGHHE